MPQIKADEITKIIREQIENFDRSVTVAEVGSVISVGDGVARIHGLDRVMAGELLSLPHDVAGLALNLEEDQVSAVLLGDYTQIQEGDIVKRTNRIMSVPVGEALVGRVVDALGRPTDGKGPILTDEFSPIERIAPGVVDRQPVREPLQTGIKAIDSMIPIGRGQRELIIGDRQTGKTAVALDTILNQRGGDVICIYVAIGQKRSTIAQVIKTLEEYDAMKYSIVIEAGSSDPAPMQYLAPYCRMRRWASTSATTAATPCASTTIFPSTPWRIAKFRCCCGVRPGAKLIPATSSISTRGCWSAPPRSVRTWAAGRSRRCRLSKRRPATFRRTFPPTSSPSPTARFIWRRDLFNSGIRPAVNAGISVSRVGGNAQIKAMKGIAGMLRLEMAQFRELAAFAQFGSDLDKATLAQLNRGRRLAEILKQDQYKPLPVEKQIAIIFAGTGGYLDDLPIEQCLPFEQALYDFMDTSYPAVGKQIVEKKEITDALRAEMRKMLDEFKAKFVAESKAKA